MRANGIAVLLMCAALGMNPGAGRAQTHDISVGGGIGLTASPRVSGRAFHGAVSFPVATLPWSDPEIFAGRPQLRVEGFYQGGTIHGWLFTCERVAQLYCVGRSDQNRIAGAAVFVRLAFSWVGPVQFYVDPFGAGVYHRRTKSSELQGPTTICVIDGEVVSCPDNPPWATFDYRSARTSVGANSGLGMRVRMGDLRMFAEFRAHRLFEPGESSAGALPVTVGVVF